MKSGGKTEKNHLVLRVDEYSIILSCRSHPHHHVYVHKTDISLPEHLPYNVGTEGRNHIIYKAGMMQFDM